MPENPYEPPKVPISAQEAQIIAREHLTHQKAPPGWAYVESVGRELADDWYFDYQLEPAVPETDREEAFGGAPGFFISKLTGRIRIASWEDRQT
jgi:hypothetical protein